MAGLHDPATELLRDIYELLDSIDDALHLARASKRLHAVYETHQYPILRNIILSSHVHVYDIRLCHFQEAFKNFASEHLPSSDTTPDSSRPSIADFEVCYNANTISEAQVWDIVARWQGLREFQHLYVNSNVNAKFSGSPLVSMWDSTEGNIEDSPEILNIVDLARKGKSAVGNIDQTKFSLSFSAAATVRFYKALTNYWLATEAKKLAHQCSYTLLSSSLCLWDRVQYIFDDRSGLQESLDVLEVYDFVCQFLCKHIDHVDKDSLDHWL